MSRDPRQPLDAEERALAVALPRTHGRAEPGPDLDARILAAAHAAIRPQAAARPRRRSWIGPTALAASLMLAVGLAWQLRPPTAPVAHERAAEVAAAPAEMDAPAMSSIEAPAQARVPPQPSSPAPMVVARPTPATGTAATAEKRMAAPAANAGMADVAAEIAAVPVAAAPLPPPPPAPARSIGDTATMPQVAESAHAPAMAKSRESDSIRQRASVTVSATAQAEDAAQRAASDATTLDTVSIEDASQDVPPATADSPEVRDAWLRRIGELLQQGKTEDAKASLAEFKRRYPDATLPAELRKLEP